jgi:hypothetical protein
MSECRYRRAAQTELASFTVHRNALDPKLSTALVHASSAANRTAAYLSDHQLNDWGYTRGSFAAAMVAQVEAEFDAADKAQAANAGFQPVTFSQLPV